MAQGGKWAWSDAEVHAILQAFTGTQAVRDRAWFAPRCELGLSHFGVDVAQGQGCLRRRRRRHQGFYYRAILPAEGGSLNPQKPSPRSPPIMTPSAYAISVTQRSRNGGLLMIAVSPWAPRSPLSRRSSIGWRRPGTASTLNVTSMNRASGLTMVAASLFPGSKPGMPCSSP